MDLGNSAPVSLSEEQNNIRRSSIQTVENLMFTSRGQSDARLSLPVEISITHKRKVPFRVEAVSSCFPSGDHMGTDQPEPSNKPSVIFLGLSAAALCSQISECAVRPSISSIQFVESSIAERTNEKAKARPSGENEEFPINGYSGNSARSRSSI
jgi:hypothetical protein